MDITVANNETPTTSKTFNLRELFENNFFFIPDYQRGYSWETEQLTDIIKDIETISELDHTHYTGTIVAAKANNPANTYELVDGQQRLTTLVILLNQIYQHSPETFEEIRPLYLMRGDLGSEQLVFQPNSDTEECFLEAIIRRKPFDATLKSHEALLNARDFFNKWLLQNEARIGEIYHTVTHKLCFLFFTPAKDKEIGIMFEVINNRGKALSELEKMKNYFIYYSTVHNKETLQKEINNRWATIQTNLSHASRTSNVDENTFLRNCYIVFFSHNKKKSWDVYDECKRHFDVNQQDRDYINESVTQMRKFVWFLADSSLYYAWFYNQKYFLSTYSGDLKKRLDLVLNYLRCQPVNASIMPLFLAVMNRRDQIKKAVELLELIEKVNMRLYVLPGIFGRTDSKQGDMFYFANEFYANQDRNFSTEETSTRYLPIPINGDEFDWLKKQLVQITLEFCGIERFKKSLLLTEDDDFNFYGWTGIRYFLACYEEAIRSSRAKRSFNIQRILNARRSVGKHTNDQLSIEHIWASNNKADEFPETYYQKRRLGNLVLCGLSSNITLSDKVIPDKVSSLMISNSAGRGALDMLQVAELAEHLHSAMQAVQSKYQRQSKNYWKDMAEFISDEREKNLIEFALKRWSLSDSENFL